MQVVPDRSLKNISLLYQKLMGIYIYKGHLYLTMEFEILVRLSGAIANISNLSYGPETFPKFAQHNFIRTHKVSSYRHSALAHYKKKSDRGG